MRVMRVRNCRGLTIHYLRMLSPSRFKESVEFCVDPGSIDPAQGRTVKKVLLFVRRFKRLKPFPGLSRARFDNRRKYCEHVVAAVL